MSWYGNTWDDSSTAQDAQVPILPVDDLDVPDTLVVRGPLDHRGDTAGFFGTTPTARPTLTYSRTGESAAEAQLRAALVALGLVVDNTVA